MFIGYIDPASGSAIVGAIAAGFAGVAVAARAIITRCVRATLAKFGVGKKKDPVNDNTGVVSEPDVSDNEPDVGDKVEMVGDNSQIVGESDDA